MDKSRTCHVLGHPIRILVDHWPLALVAVVAMRESRAAQCERSNESRKHIGGEVNLIYRKGECLMEAIDGDLTRQLTRDKREKS